MKNRFYLACFRDNVGSNVAWHAKNGRGYVTDISQAQVYTREEAQQKWEYAREYDQPISADHVDALAVWKVDCQYILNDLEIDSEHREYVAYQRRRWDGNDVFFITEELPSTDFSQAIIFDIKEKVKDPRIIFIPRKMAENVQRRTFDYAKLHRRTMVQGAGLTIPEHIKKLIRRSDSGKTRFNCPTCGKISWQHNPYDFEGCLDVFCEAYT